MKLSGRDRNYINGELAKYESWDHVDEFINMMFESNSQFQNCKKNGVGRTIILKFLGGEPIWAIQQLSVYLDKR